MFRQMIFLFAALALIAQDARAGDESRIGTAAAQELRIPIGSRGTALGGAILAHVKGAEALQWNPSGLVFGTHKREAIFSYLD